MAYESGRSASMFYFAYIQQNYYEPKRVMNRITTSDPTVLKWFEKARSGDVNLDLRNKMIYDPRVLHSYSNTPYMSVVITPGTTVVSVGFVDLGFLREATLEGGENSNYRTTKWVGFEATSYTVAKTLVITKAHVDSILQVWYSSCWNSRTLCDFRTAISSILTDKKVDSRSVGHPEVRFLLEHWLPAKVSIATARSLWLNNSPDTVKWRKIGNFNRPRDRKALCQYLMTGQVLEATLGSVVMFSLPLGYPGKLSPDSNMFESIPIHRLVIAMMR